MMNIKKDYQTAIKYLNDALRRKHHDEWEDALEEAQERYNKDNGL